MVLESLLQIQTVINHGLTAILLRSLPILLFLLFLHLHHATTIMILTFKIICTQSAAVNKAVYIQKVSRTTYLGAKEGRSWTPNGPNQRRSKRLKSFIRPRQLAKIFNRIKRCCDGRLDAAQKLLLLLLLLLRGTTWTT